MQAPKIIDIPNSFRVSTEGANKPKFAIEEKKLQIG